MYRKIRFWWDFKSPAQLPLILNSNINGLDTSSIISYSWGEADELSDRLVGLDIHMNMKHEMILDRIDRVVKG